MLAEIDGARAEARRRTWALAGSNAPDHNNGARQPLVVDLDAGSGAGGGAGGLVVLRADSAYYNADVVAAAHRCAAKVSIIARMGPTVDRVIASIPDHAWPPIHYPNAVWDDDEQRLISDAEVAEVPFTAFASRPHHLHAHGRLIVQFWTGPVG